MNSGGGPLAGIRLIELAGVGAAPYGCMMLADMGAEVVRVERPDSRHSAEENSPLLRNRRSMVLDLKLPAARALLLAMTEKCDGLIEAYRPGVAERLGVGPQACHARNPRLVYARMTGWGQMGPLAQSAGHDLNYIGLAGMLHQIGPKDGKPVVPLNVIGDFGGGGLLLAFGVACALIEARRSGQGQVVDAAMLDGTLSFMAMFFGFRAAGQFDDRTGTHMLGGGAHFYNVYETQDGKYLSVAAIEPQFYCALLEKLGLANSRWLAAGYPAYDPHITDQEWPALKSELQIIFRTRTRDDWCRHFEGSEVCVTPVLSLADAAIHPHNIARGAFIEVGGVQQNAPAPRFSRTSPSKPTAPPRPGADGDDVVRDWQIDPELVSKARDAGAFT